MTVCVTGEIAIIDSDNGLSPDLRQAIISTNALLLLIGPYFNRYSINHDRGHHEGQNYCNTYKTVQTDRKCLHTTQTDTINDFDV